VHRNNFSDIYPTKCNITHFILSGNCSTCFEWYLQPSSGEQTTVSTASGICRTVTVICHYRGRFGTGLSVLWVASTLKPVPTLSRQWQITVTVWQIPDAVDTVVCAPDDGWRYHSKHVEQFPDKIKCVKLHLVGYISEQYKRIRHSRKVLDISVRFRIYLEFPHTFS
jgi:hypothetical protein